MINYNNFINQMFNLLVKVNVVNSDELVILIEDSIKLSNKDFPYCSSIKSIHSKKIFNKYERYFKFTTKSDSIKLQKEYQKKHLSNATVKPLPLGGG